MAEEPTSREDGPEPQTPADLVKGMHWPEMRGSPSSTGMGKQGARLAHWDSHMASEEKATSDGVPGAKSTS